MNELGVDVLLLSHGGITEAFLLRLLELLLLFGNRLHLVEEELQVSVRQLLVGKGVRDELGVFDFLIVVDVDLIQDFLDLLVIKLFQLLEFNERILERQLRVVILDDLLLFL